jgi:hypothetical protein
MSDCICRLKQQECTAIVHDYDPIPVVQPAWQAVGYQRGYDAAVREIVAWLREGDRWRPISESRAIKCEHGSFGWEECGECSIQQAADAIERGEHKGTQQ